MPPSFRAAVSSLAHQLLAWRDGRVRNAIDALAPRRLWQHTQPEVMVIAESSRSTLWEKRAKLVANGFMRGVA